MKPILVNIKKILFLILLISSQAFCQKKREGGPLLEYLSQKINKEISFVDYEQNENLYRIHSIQYYDHKNQDYVQLNQSDIKILYPELCDWFTIEISHLKSKKKKKSK